jgi:hypothetical protein
MSPLEVRFRPRRFAIAILILVVLPVVAMISAYPIGKLGKIGEAIAWNTLIAAVFYFYPPSRIFGPPHFSTGIGAGPEDITGFLETVAFYGIIAMLFSFSFKRRRTN